MYKISLIIICLFSGIITFSQVNSLPAFEQQRIKYNKKGMLLLGSWSATNIIISGLASKTNNQQAHYFHNMNVIYIQNPLQWRAVGGLLK